MNTSLSLATAPDTDEAPCTTTALLAEGLRWLHDTVQPGTAIVHARGAATVIAAATESSAGCRWDGAGRPTSSLKSLTSTGDWAWGHR
jgi:hypothetical protein